MHDIPLPLTHCMRLVAAAIVTAPVVVVGVSPIAVIWRLSAMLLILLTGAYLWRRYRRWRPTVLHVGPENRLSCTLASGRRIGVDQVLPGFVAPGMVLAMLVGPHREAMSLVVPGRSLHADAHWRLRRALLAWRGTAGGELGAQRDQSFERGGT